MKERAGAGSDPSLTIEMMRIVSLAEASRLCGLNEQTLRKHHADKIIQLSPNRKGMRVRDALMLKDGTATP